jgi:hypothetical protein
MQGISILECSLEHQGGLLLIKEVRVRVKRKGRLERKRKRMI